MIATDFAANESWDDAFAALKIMLRPWAWNSGNALQQVRRYFGNKFPGYDSFYFLSGRAALFHLLKSLHLADGSEVIVQAFTCEAVILPILATGLKPVYCDIETSSFSMNPIALQKKITDRTNVIILQHSFGLKPAHRNEVLSIVRKHDLLLIEDIAHGYSQDIVSEYSKAPYNKHCFLMSFGRSKAYSSVFGGAILTSNKTLKNPIEGIRQSLRYPSFFLTLRLLLYKPLSVLIKSTYDICLGKILHRVANFLRLLIPEITAKEKQGTYDALFDKAYPNALAELLLVQLNKHEHILRSKAQICAIYRKNIKYQILTIKKSESLLRYPLLADNRDFVLNKAARQNIFLGSWYNQVIAPKTLDLHKMGYQNGSCPVAEKTSKQIINLPLNISQQEALKVISLLS